jgi:RNA polymerase sigma-70 factor (ECF subfamily)
MVAGVRRESCAPLAIGLLKARANLAVMEASADTELMQRYAAGDLAAFKLLYARHKAALYRYLKRMCHDPEVANDLFQEVWSKLIASRGRYEARAQFNTFLYRIAHNTCIDHFRRHGRVPAAIEDEGLIAELPDTDHPGPDQEFAAAETQQAFRAALQALPPEQRDVFLLYEESGLSLEEIGRVTDVSMETAKSRLRYAVSKLRAALKRYRLPEAVS